MNLNIAVSPQSLSSSQKLLDKIRKRTQQAASPMSNSNWMEEAMDDLFVTTGFPKHVFERGEPIHQCLAVQSVYSFNFHLLVWAITSEQDTSSFGFLCDKKSMRDEAPTCYLITTDLAAAEAFRAWWKQYCTRFEDNETGYVLPKLKPGKSVTVCPVAHSECAAMAEEARIMDMPSMRENTFLQWCWIVSNTHSPVYFTMDYWWFTDENDAMAFKLRFA